MLVLDKKDGSLSAHYKLEQRDGVFYTVKSFDDTYLIVADSPSQTEDDVRALFVPLGTLYKGAYLKDISPKEIATVIHPETNAISILWEVDLKYDSKFDVDQDQDNPTQVDPDDPTDTTPRRRIFSTKEEEVMTNDPIDNIPIESVNGERIITTRRRSVINLEITRFEQYPNDYTQIIPKYDAIVDHINSDTFYGKPPHYAYMDDINVDETLVTQSNGVKKLWLEVTYRIQFKTKHVLYNGTIEERPGWMKFILNEGYLVRPEIGAKPEIYIEPKSKQPLKVNLTADGTKLPEGDDPTLLEFHEGPEAPFGPLGLEY